MTSSLAHRPQAAFLAARLFFPPFNSEYLADKQFIPLVKRTSSHAFCCKPMTMPSHKKGSKSSPKGAARPAKDSTRTKKSQISAPVRFLLVVLSSLALSSGLFSLTSQIHLDELRTVSKPLDSWSDVGGLLAWRAVEVGLAWVLGYDGNFLLPSCF